MKKTLLVAATLIFPALSSAETVYLDRQNVSQPEVVDVGRASNSPQQVYVVQQSPSVRSSQVTVVEDSPLKESKADSIRRSRLEIESQTEARIVERLENERIKSERERADKLSQMLEGQPAAQPVVQQPALAPVQYQPVQYAPQAPQVVNVGEVNAVVSSEDELDAELSSWSKTKFYVGGAFGLTDYPRIRNIRGIYSAGATVGAAFPENLAVEATFLYSSFDVEPISGYYNPMYPNISRMDQTNYLGAVKYQLMDGRFRPVVGGATSYTRRVYTDKRQYYQGPAIVSNAFDLGFNGGFDILLSRAFTLSMDFRYMFNMSYRIEGPYQTSLINPQQFGEPVESLDYYTLTFGGRFTF